MLVEILPEIHKRDQDLGSARARGHILPLPFSDLLQISIVRIPGMDNVLVRGMEYVSRRSGQLLLCEGASGSALVTHSRVAWVLQEQLSGGDLANVCAA